MLFCWNVISKGEEKENQCFKQSHIAGKSNNKQTLYQGFKVPKRPYWPWQPPPEPSHMWPGDPFQLRCEPTVPASSYLAGMLVSSTLQAMPEPGHGSTDLDTWPVDRLLSLASDCSHPDGPACWAVSDPSSPHQTWSWPVDWLPSFTSNLPHHHKLIWWSGLLVEPDCQILPWQPWHCPQLTAPQPSPRPETALTATK